MEAAVPVGEWVYSVTPVVGTSWQGAESAKSAPIEVVPAAPVAVADSHSVAEDATPTVAAPGVLVNDTGTGTLTAILVSAWPTGP